jgi:hypothetical protein
MMRLKAIQNGRLYIKALMLIFVAIWLVAFGVFAHSGIGKASAHLSLFWDLDFLFCPFIFATLRALLAYDSSQDPKSPSGLPRLAEFVGWALLAAFVLVFVSVLFAGMLGR